MLRQKTQLEVFIFLPFIIYFLIPSFGRAEELICDVKGLESIPANEIGLFTVDTLKLANLGYINFDCKKLLFLDPTLNQTLRSIAFVGSCPRKATKFLSIHPLPKQIKLIESSVLINENFVPSIPFEHSSSLVAWFIFDEDQTYDLLGSNSYAVSTSLYPDWAEPQSSLTCQEDDSFCAVFIDNNSEDGVDTPDTYIRVYLENSNFSLSSGSIQVGFKLLENSVGDKILVSDPQSKFVLGINQDGFPFFELRESQVHLITGRTKVSLDSWHDLLVSFEARRKKVHLYLNGEKIATKRFRFSKHAPRWDAVQKLILGGDMDNNRLSTFKGELSYLRLYKKSLNSNEVKAAYHVTRSNGALECKVTMSKKLQNALKNLKSSFNLPKTELVSAKLCYMDYIPRHFGAPNIEGYCDTIELDANSTLPINLFGQPTHFVTIGSQLHLGDYFRIHGFFLKSDDITFFKDFSVSFYEYVNPVDPSSEKFSIIPNFLIGKLFACGGNGGYHVWVATRNAYSSSKNSKGRVLFLFDEPIVLSGKLSFEVRFYPTGKLGTSYLEFEGFLISDKDAKFWISDITLRGEEEAEEYINGCKQKNKLKLRFSESFEFIASIRSSSKGEIELVLEDEKTGNSVFNSKNIERILNKLFLHKDLKRLSLTDQLGNEVAYLDKSNFRIEKIKVDKGSSSRIELSSNFRLSNYNMQKGSCNVLELQDLKKGEVYRIVASLNDLPRESIEKEEYCSGLVTTVEWKYFDLPSHAVLKKDSIAMFNMFVNDQDELVVYPTDELFEIIKKFPKY